jgi:hypothetical protein
MSARPFRNEVVSVALPALDAGVRKPMTGGAARCARSADGTIAAVATPAMNSRRRIPQSSPASGE